MWYVFIIFFIEIWLLIEIGGAIGFLGTMFWFIASAMVGIFLLKTQGFRLKSQLHKLMNEGESLQDSSHELLLGLAALLLIIPGYLSDTISLLLFMPPLRVMLLNRLKNARSDTVVRLRIRK